ncbi:hypothetical protein GV794_27955 [Nocardia cyriacigeorgica]|uniref:Uncharacterized protein n=1 Tax=Nocardia cyriacigeorgica TaxID=135487 RepID=A0A6P1DIB5_9NOCA|nr:hypothetical protein [Nocardia cyriacigeorgica]NEW42612.1 hypothetical protein [Nocardia cyriacigeorgica]NEW48152.1 hypothetical protein [Nocardia cyriacigeorgica]NEW53717.1 hypothetical protein [Nocardia cyriacigeorgica]NEW59437.1 hypothetical protein [Nocardia cyriacigeorgica]
MSYDHILLPSGAATTPAEVDAYLTTQQGQPEAEIVAAIAAEVNRRNEELPEEDTFLGSGPVGGAATGSVLQISSPYDAIGFVRELLFELATPQNYAVYDPQLTWLIDPAGHVPVSVSHGGAGEFPYLTEALARRWVAELAKPNPYLVVSRGEQDYIQTYREEPGYILEYRDGSPDRHFTTTLDDSAQVAELIWAWTAGDHSALQDVAWTRLKL